MLQPVQIREVLRAARSPLVAGQVLSGQDGDWLIEHARPKPLRPGLLEGNAIDARAYVDAERGDANLENDCRLTQVRQRRLVSGAPNCASAAMTREAFLAAGLTQTSRSPVALTRPCAAIA